MQKQTNDHELLWKQYSQLIDLYKFYLDLALKANVFFYAITGSILTFYFSNKDSELSKFSLILPIVLSLLFGAIFSYGAILMKIFRDEIFNIRNMLKLHVAPETNILITFLKASAAIFFVVAVAMIVLLIIR
ncbi:MAG: hypothetical protein ACREOI_27845 [bacterium]